QQQRHKQGEEEEEEEATEEHSGGGVVKVKTGEEDGVRIEFVGQTKGTIPEPARPSSPSREAAAVNQNSASSAAAAAAAAAGMEFQLLQCDGESHRDGTEGGLTVKGVWSHLRNKLEQSWEKNAQRIAPSSDGGGASSGEGAAADSKSTGGSSSVAGTAAPGSGRAGGFGRALAVASAPVYYLFGLLGDVPGWFSDVVFEVSLKDASVGQDFSQRLILVQNRPRFMTLACALVAPSHLPSSPAAAAAAAAAATAASVTAVVPRLARKFCSADAPFPGKVVSRPCRASQQQQRQQQQPSKGWVSTVVQSSLSFVGFGDGGGGGGGGGGGDGGGSGNGRNDGAISSSSYGGSGGVCSCLAGNGGPCTIRASPGRDPCLYVDVSGSGRRGGGGGGDGGGGYGYGAESMDTFSEVALRTYSLVVQAATKSTTAERAGRGAAAGAGAGVGETENATVADALAALQAAAVERGFLPSGVAVPVYAAVLAAGVVLLFVARPLSESRTFHYLLSVLLGAPVAAAAIVLRAVKNPRWAFLRWVLLLGCGLAMWLVVAAGVGVIPSPADLLSNLPGAMSAFWTGGLVGWPWAGKAFFVTSGLAGVLITRWQGLFLDEGDGPRGSWLNGQACIRRVLIVSGIVSVYHGVSDTDVGLALVLLALAAPTLAHYARRYSMWSNRW
ncbi:unnamed protein product, partial [Pylaiella littoralis]